jgi:hypothetical protein
MTSKDEKPVKKVKEDITLQNFAIQNNISDMTLAGLKTYLQSKLQDNHDKQELTKSYKKYLGMPGFIQIKEE